MWEKRRLRVSESRVLRTVFGPRREEVTRQWRKQHNEEIYYLYSSPNIVRVKKSRRMRLEGHVARIGEKRGVYRVLVGKSEGKRLLAETQAYGKIILRWIFRKWDVGEWTGSSWLRIRTGGGHL